MPQVTVAIPVHNGAPHLTTTLASLAQQSFQDFEVLILDDGSTDDSIEIIERYCEKKQVRILQNSEVRGLVAGRNQLLTEAKGEYVAWLDQDDLAAPDRLLRQVAFMKSSPETVVLGSASVFFEVKGGVNKQYTVKELKRYPLSPDEIKCRLVFENCFDCSAVMQRLSVANECGFRESDGLALDYGLWLRLSEKFKLRNLPQFLSAWRVHSAQNSRGLGGKQINEASLRMSVVALEKALNTKFDAWDKRSMSIIKCTAKQWEVDDIVGTFAFLEKLWSLNESTLSFPMRRWRSELRFQGLRLMYLYRPLVSFSKLISTLKFIGSEVVIGELARAPRIIADPMQMHRFIRRIEVLERNIDYPTHSSPRGD